MPCSSAPQSYREGPPLPPIPPTVSSSSYPQEDGMLPHHRKKLSNFDFCAIQVCYTQVSGPAQATCSNTLSSTRTRHFHTLLCVHNPTKDSVIYVCLQAHAPQITLHCSPASCLNVSLFAHVHMSHLHSIFLVYV